MKTSVFTIHHEESIGNRTYETYADLLPSGREQPLIDPERFRQALAMLPLRYADVLEMIALGQSQAEIAKVMGISQPGVSYIAQKAGRAIRLIVSLPPITEEQIIEDLAAIFEPDELALLRYFYRTSCFTHTLLLLGVDRETAYGQASLCRRRIRHYIGRMRAYDATEYADYILVFDFLLKHVNVWADIRGVHTPETLSVRDTTTVEIIGVKRAKHESRPAKYSPEELRLRRAARLIVWRAEHPERVRLHQETARRKAKSDA
jgi:hypothetical protein